MPAAEPQQAALAGAVLADNSDHRAVGRHRVEILAGARS